MSPQTMTERDGYVATFDREYQTTLKLLRNFPADQIEIRPTPKSQTARELAWTLVMSQNVVEPILAGALTPGKFPEAPPTWEAILQAFQEAHGRTMGLLANVTESQFNGTVKMPVGPNQVGEVRTGDALWMMLYDTIHHRGQMTVYVRKAGGKVPSIYGPSGDEPWW